MKRTKQVASILLAGMLALNMTGMSAMAGASSEVLSGDGVFANSDSNTNTTTITIDASISKKNFTAYQILTGSVDNNNKFFDVSWGTDFDVEQIMSALKKNEKLKGEFSSNVDTLTAEEFAKVISSDDFTAADKQELVTVLSGCIKDGAEGTTITSNQNTLPNGGYYLIMDASDANSNDVKNMTLLLAVTGEDNEIKEKVAIPTMTHEILHNEEYNSGKESLSSTDAWGPVGDNQIGDEVQFLIQPSIPSYLDFTDEYTYTVHVRLQDGLTLSDCGVYTVLDEDDPTFYTDAEENENYTVTELSEKDLENSDDWSGCTGFDVTITIDPENPPQQLYLLYKANLEPDPKKGICNYETSTAWLEYPDPETGSNSTTEQIEVYDYPLAVEVKKLSNEQDEDGEPINLTGAKFVLISADDYDGWKGAGYDIHLDDDGGLVIQDASGFDFSGSSGLISLQSISADNNEYQIVDSASSNDNVVQYFEAGDTWIYGLDDQKQYYLYEIEAPNGYRKSTDLIPFAIKPAEYNPNTQALVAYTILNDDDDDETPYKLVENSVVPDYVAYSQDGDCENSISITNTSIQTFLLPTTGGMGTRIFYVLGSVLVLGSAVLLITKRRMRVENDSKDE